MIKKIDVLKIKTMGTIRRKNSKISNDFRGTEFKFWGVFLLTFFQGHALSLDESYDTFIHVGLKFFKYYRLLWF